MKSVIWLQSKSFPKDNSYNGNDSAIFSSPGQSPERAIVLAPASALALALALAKC